MKNLKSWTMLVNGEPTGKWSFGHVSENEIVFMESGLVIIFM